MTALLLFWPSLTPGLLHLGERAPPQGEGTESAACSHGDADASRISSHCVMVVRRRTVKGKAVTSPCMSMATVNTQQGTDRHNQALSLSWGLGEKDLSVETWGARHLHLPLSEYL